MLGLGTAVVKLASSFIAQVGQFFKADTNDYSVDTTTIKVDEVII